MELKAEDFVKGGVGLVTGGPVGMILSPLAGRALKGKTVAWALIGIIAGPISWVISSIPLAVISAITQGSAEKTVSTPAPGKSLVESPSSRQEQVAKESPQRSDAAVNMENYNKLETGMTYGQVVEILGEQGTEMSSNEIGGMKTVMYMWKAGRFSGANMNAMFQNDGLVSKAQFGLK